jgi:hypothetical protein
MTASPETGLRASLLGASWSWCDRSIDHSWSHQAGSQRSYGGDAGVMADAPCHAGAGEAE